MRPTLTLNQKRFTARSIVSLDMSSSVRNVSFSQMLRRKRQKLQLAGDVNTFAKKNYPEEESNPIDHDVSAENSAVMETFVVCLIHYLRKHHEKTHFKVRLHAYDTKLRITFSTGMI